MPGVVRTRPRDCLSAGVRELYVVELPVVGLTWSWNLNAITTTTETN